MTRVVNDINELGLGIGAALVINRNGKAMKLGQTKTKESFVKTYQPETFLETLGWTLLVGALTLTGFFGLLFLLFAHYA